MGFTAPCLQLLTFLCTLVLASLDINGCGALSNLRQASLKLHDTTALRFRLRGEAQEEQKDLWEALRELERGTRADAIAESWEHNNGEEEEEEEEEEERHPADELLQRHQADATISYILGGY